ncbi:TPA: C4-dicarboxylate transporter [Klebsiella pneumoniae]|uniref:SLAC1 family transporter n=1 Tax=Klebsiella pneumoniae TaxID=573 RepID=UPI001E5F0CF7|nr:C4-dicarboxylate transporter [Klebsiella pneumoniae]
MSEKFQTVSFDLYSSVMGITGLGLVWRAAAKTYDVSALPGEVFLATGSGFLLAMGLLPYSILLAKVLWIAAVAAQIFFLTCTFRRWLIDQLDTHEISPVWLIPMVGNASPAFAGVDLGFPGLSKMLLFSALLCWALFMPLILWRIVFVRPVTPQKAMPGLAIMVSAPAVIAVGLYCIYGGMNDVIEFMAWTALFFAIVLISLWRRMIPDTFGRIWWGFTFPSTALASALIRVDAASMTTLNHTLALAALTFATFVVCSIIVMTVRQSLLTLCWGRHAKHSG